LTQSSARFPAESWFWGFCLLGSLTVLAPFVILVILGYASQLDFGMPTFLAALSTVYSGTRLTLLSIEGRKKLFSMTFWIFSYVWMGLVPLVQLSTGEFPWPGNYDEWIAAYALIIILVGYVAYDVGSWLGSSYYHKNGGRLLPYHFYLSKWRVYLLSLFAPVAALIAIQKLGGADVILNATRYSLDQVTNPEAVTPADRIWNTLQRIPAYIALLTTWLVWLNRKLLLTRRWQKASHVAVLVLLLMLNLVVNNPILLNRYFLGTILFSFAVMTLGWNERRSFGVWVVGLVFALVVLFPYADLFREENQSVTIVSVTSQFTSNGDYDAFQQIANTVMYVSADGITYGHQLLGAMFFWVPSAVWPDKPVGSGQVVAEHLGYTFTNLSSPLWAEAFINAGFVGVVAILLLYGLVTSLLQQSYVASTKAQGSLFIGGLVPILAGFQFFFLRGDLLNGIAYMVPMLVFYLSTAGVTRAPPRARQHKA
jgi:hypothetical protein